MNNLRILIITGIIFVLISSCKKEEIVEQSETVIDTIKIGAMYAFEQNGYIHGESNTKILELATSELNAYFSANQINKEVELIIKDTEGSISGAIQKLNEFIADNVKIIITSTSSSDLEMLKPIADENDLVLISQTSTSPSLSVEDNIFRFVPDDSQMANVFGAVLNTAGVKKSIIVNRVDIWGTDLAELLYTANTASGINSESRISYQARIMGEDFDTVISDLNDLVISALETYDTTEIAINLICLDEAIDFLSKASTYPLLSKVKWYGTDGIAQNRELLVSTSAAEFASQTELISPIIAENNSTEYTRIKEAIESETGKTAYSYSVYLYDVLFIAAKSYHEMGATFDLATYKSKLSSVAAANTGLYGNIILNSAGDMDSYSYDFWNVVKTGTTYSWTKKLADQKSE